MIPDRISRKIGRIGKAKVNRGRDLQRDWDETRAVWLRQRG
jgi:hypothetical protein